MAITIGSIGYNRSHDARFEMHRPDGPGCYLFLLVKTSARFELGDKRFDVSEGSCVVIRPRTPCRYRAEKDAYRDDWIYLTMDEADEQRLTRNGIPFDCPARLESIDELSHIVHLIAFEHFSSDLFHREIRDGYTEILFLKLGRAIHSGKADSLGAMDAKNDRVTYLRTRIYENPAYFAGVDEMADFVGLSRSGLQHLYTRLFGIHVLEDVISARIEMAKKLLGTTTMTVAEIAERCGYRSEYHFMRQFKQRMAATPTEFRNGDSWNQIAASR